MKVRKDDQVLVLTGDDQGKRGRVLKVFPKTNRIIVEGINFVKRHQRASQKQTQGGIVTKEASINVSNVMVVCPKCNKTTKLGIKQIRDENKGRTVRVRYCKKCEEMLVKAA